MKKCFLALLLGIASIQLALAQEPLETVIKNKDWTELAKLCGDDTHQQLASYFQDCTGVGFNLLRQNDLMFFARFRDFGEIGEITFTTENGKYRQLSLKSDIKPLYFVNSFSRFDVADRTIRMGDAEIFFKKGVLYQGLPMGNLFIFCGEWEFKIQPQDEEERLTLLDQIHSDTFIKESQTGIFILSPSQLVAGLPAPTLVNELDDEETKLLYGIFQKNWGIHVSFFNELWYFPFAADFNGAIFYQKPGKSFFRYIFNRAIAPDTSLILYPENKFYLNYNAVKGLKYITQSVDELENQQLNLFYNPQAHFLSGTAVLNFKEPSNVKMINLDPGLVVKGFGKSQNHELNLFNRGDNYYLLGADVNKFSFYYAGSIRGSEEAGEVIRIDMKDLLGKDKDRYFILNRDQDFYPNPGPHFFKNSVKISVPYPLQCLVSGNRSSQQRLGDRNEFVYQSPGSKGISLVCGNFEKLLTVSSKLPIHVFGNAKLKIRNYFSPEEVQDCFDFLLEKFGPLEISELNLLLRHHRNYGGLSNQGFVVLNLLDSAFQIDESSTARRIRRESPVVFTDVNRDELVHELAHQWWGGVISWKSYQDQWITEGLSQFSILFYLQNNLSDSKFRRVVAGVKRWIFRNNDAGPIIYGKRIANLSNDINTYQSIVYNKSALVFMMLKEMLGEEELLQRLRQLLVQFKLQSLPTGRFIQQMCQGDKRLQKFFNGWIYSRKIPQVRYQVTNDGKNAEITFTQMDTDCVFPLGIRITSQEGKSFRMVIIEEKVQRFKFSENSPILSIDVNPLVSPVDLQE